MGGTILKQTRTWLFSMAAMLLLVLGCNTGGDETAEASEPAASEPAASESTESTATHWQKDGLTVTAMTDSPAFSDATLSVNSPSDGDSLSAGPVNFDFTVENYNLGEQTPDAATKGIANSDKGQHIHLILNNGPYSAHYEAGFEKEMEAGHYVMLAFLSRSYHESVKNDAAALVQQFTVGDVDAEAADLTAPHMFYSRPKGTYTGDDTKKLMLDFFLLNTTIAPDGNKVRATINGTEFIFTEWVPYVIEGLAMGEVTIRLELIDADGNVVPGPFNDVTRTVTLEAGE